MEIKWFLLIVILVQIVENCALSNRIFELEQEFFRLKKKVR